MTCTGSSRQEDEHYFGRFPEHRYKPFNEEVKLCKLKNLENAHFIFPQIVPASVSGRYTYTRQCNRTENPILNSFGNLVLLPAVPLFPNTDGNFGKWQNIRIPNCFDSTAKSEYVVAVYDRSSCLQHLHFLVNQCSVSAYWSHILRKESIPNPIIN